MIRAIVRQGRRDVIGLLAAMALLPVAMPWTGRIAQAEISSADAEAVVNQLAAEVWSTLGRSDLDDQARIDILATRLVARTDVDLLSRLVLGRYWHQLEEQQQTRYQTLFGDVVMRTLARRLNQFGKDAEGPFEERFMLLSSAPAGQSDILVRSTVRPLSGDNLSVDWRLREGDGGPVIIDVIIEGVSLLVSQRSEFAAVIERSNMEGLLAELQARADSTRS
jgi:phospholipid transport system substrate-binding protein